MGDFGFMSRSSLIALIVLSLGSIVFYAWLMHAVMGMSITRVVSISAMVVVVLATVTYRHIRQHGIEPGVRADSARVVNVGASMPVAAALVWTAIYLRGQEHQGAGMIAPLCAAGVAVYGIRGR
jgi:hypothetical protein